MKKMNIIIALIVGTALTTFAESSKHGEHKAEDSHGVGAAYLHEVYGTPLALLEPPHDATGQRRVAELLDVFAHAGSSSMAMAISPKRRSVSSASSWFTVAIA